jgi:D-alanyl-D-alanine endopeptidase (penicillin-binding protein 7)
MLLAAGGLALVPVSGEVLAAPKKKVAVTKPHIIVAKRHRHSVRQYSTARAERPLATADSRAFGIQSASAVVVDQTNGAVLYEKNADAVVPIASITKLMTAMVVLDAKPDLGETLTVTDQDVDLVKSTRSHLKPGTQLTREEMLRLALMASENRAAAALSRHYAGGREAFVAAMNRKAGDLGLADTHFYDPTGLTASNVSSGRDLTRMVGAAYQYPLIRSFSTTTEYPVTVAGRSRTFHNTNRLVKSTDWDIGLSKTGYINEAGKCLVMQAWVNNRPTIIVLLDSWGKLTRIADANRIRRWIEGTALSVRPTITG